MKLFKIFIAILLIGLNVKTAEATPEASWENDKVRISVYSQFSEITPDTPNQYLIAFQMLNGWHISADNPGDAGVPTNFKWNQNTRRINNTTPEYFLYENIIGQYGYGDKAYYLFSTDKKPTNLTVEWTACKDYCEPETTEFPLSLPKLSQENIENSVWAEIYTTALETFPIKTKLEATAVNNNYTLDISIPLQNYQLDVQIEPFYFIPYRQNIFSASAEQTVAIDNNTLHITVEAEGEGIPDTGGILIYGDKAYHIGFTTHTTAISLFYILFLAFIGGIILNCMPCVFPILSIKALSLSQNVHNKHHIRNAIIYLSGVLVCFTIIAGILYLLRRSGEAIGWGFQLQSPIFVACMLIVFIIFLLMLLEIIRPPVSLLNWLTRLSGTNSFLTGLFAVLIASPCTGPFMGAALGYALLQPSNIYFPIFLSLGLGYALPFTLIELFPSVIRKIMPKSGRWTTIFKYILALPIFLTCIWLAWLLFNLLKPMDKADDLWIPYNSEEVQKLVENHRPVLIDFTAKWCLTCLLNEKATLNSDEFLKFAEDNNIALVKADWTSRDENISKALQFYGRNSVPLYVYYQPNGNYTILPQILTPNIVIKSILND